MIQFCAVFMDINYTITGNDGQTYGPVSLAELQTWIRDGRVNAQTNVMRSDVNAWHQASQYQELNFAAVAAAAPSTISPGQTQYGASRPAFVAGQFPELEKKIKNGAGWFYWIAGLSLINSIAVLAGQEWGFFLSLGATFFAAGIGLGLGGTLGMIIGGGICTLICGLFVMFGIFANKRHSWAFIVGLVLYLLDSLIYLFAQEWGSLGFHIFAAFCIFIGLKANLDLKKETAQ